jgi:hypothetical protein
LEGGVELLGRTLVLRVAALNDIKLYTHRVILLYGIFGFREMLQRFTQ